MFSTVQCLEICRMKTVKIIKFLMVVQTTEVAVVGITTEEEGAAKMDSKIVPTSEITSKQLNASSFRAKNDALMVPIVLLHMGLLSSDKSLANKTLIMIVVVDIAVVVAEAIKVIGEAEIWTAVLLTSCLNLQTRSLCNTSNSRCLTTCSKWATMAWTKVTLILLTLHKIRTKVNLRLSHNSQWAWWCNLTCLWIQIKLSLCIHNLQLSLEMATKSLTSINKLIIWCKEWALMDSIPCKTCTCKTSPNRRPILQPSVLSSTLRLKAKTGSKSLCREMLLSILSITLPQSLNRLSRRLNIAMKTKLTKQWTYFSIWLSNKKFRWLILWLQCLLVKTVSKTFKLQTLSEKVILLCPKARMSERTHLPWES